MTTDGANSIAAMRRRYDDLPPAEAALAAWTARGSEPGLQRAYQIEVRRIMPLLARALDRLAVEHENARVMFNVDARFNEYPTLRGS